MTVQKFRKRPVVIEAIQFDGSHPSADEVIQFCPTATKCMTGGVKSYLDSLSIPTLEGNMTANVGDWIIRGIKGEFYPCKPDIFERTYELVE